ncbi:MAG: hypothetical protein ACLFVW_09100 [Phycisphaerae bacterium]
MRDRSSTAGFASAFLVVFSAALSASAGPEVRQDDDTLTVDLDNGAVLHFALQDGLLLGLNRVVVDGVELTSPDTLQRPVIAQEYAQDRHILPLTRLRQAEVNGDEVRIEVSLLATDSEQAYREFFVFAGDRGAALEKGRTEKLERLAREKEQATSEVEVADAIAAYESELDRIALEYGDIHRDHYLLPHARLPAEICRVNAVSQLADSLGKRLQPGGKLTWHIRPTEQNIAGWQYVGWRQHYSFELTHDRKVNKLWQVGTWEIDKSTVGLTVAALRYRGLGKIEQSFTADDDGGAAEAFSTTETMPGAVGSAPLVSPVVPEGSDVSDRGYALRHRTGAWIAQMARGAGAPFVDFQWRGGVVLASYPDRQGSLRALTEVMPGDTPVSQTDCEYFALASEHSTIPQNYLALVCDEPLADHQARTRWQEVDEFVREQVSEELGFVRYEVAPGVGILYDNGWADYYQDLADRYLDQLADMGVRLIAVHNPGWVNGRYQGPNGPEDTGGGVCSIYDWWPTEDMVGPWKAFQDACRRRKVAYYPWMGATQWRDAPFVREVGLDKRHWALNAPDAPHSSGDGAEHMQGNMLDDRFREVFLRRLDRVRREFGYQGFWCDSFQNLFMTQLNWSHGTGESLQRAWWEQISAWTREGVGWMAESHSFPGMSCSIEVHGWQDQPWYFRNVFKWLRGTSQQEYSQEELSRLVFEVMANKGWVAPDISYNRPLAETLPAFEHLAKQYNAALPLMRRGYILSDDRGVLHLRYSGNGEGVWFAFTEADCPKGVTARPIEDEQAPYVEKVKAHNTYHVTADDLLKRFGVRTGDLDDPRIGRKYNPPGYGWPERDNQQGDN